MLPRAPRCSSKVLLSALACLFPAALFAQTPPPLSASELLPVPALSPKIEKELGKALEDLRGNKLADARHHLDVVFKFAPTNADLNFLFGIYSAEMSDWAKARNYWESVLAVDPNHLNALLSLSEACLRENKLSEAISYLDRAIEAEPTSWRPHATLADAYLKQGSSDEAIREARRAIELGHSRADTVQPILARALHMHGEQEAAIEALQAYVKGHPTDASAIRQLAAMQGDSRAADQLSSSSATTLPVPESKGLATALLAANWMPTDVDEKIPPVKVNAACNLEEILEKSGKRIEELVANVDKFAATEVVSHQSIDKWGFPSRPVLLKFDYLVSIAENLNGVLTVEEERQSKDSSAKFPDGIETHGLPALVLIFHPKYTKNFTMSCEGLAQSQGSEAWQVYFRQRPDRPNLIRTYQIGINGPVYSIALKGRAWIAADTFQIIRLETDLINPVPEIRLVSDHAAIEYGRVHFKSRDLDMWLPQYADLHYDWRGRRAHRRHSFKNYLLFSVDDTQRISVPKATPPAS
jgi:tetratricopeptide (TPR) repeat protein